MLRAPRVQRPDRVPDRLGAPPRLPDRDRARRALRAALLRPRDRLGAPDAPSLGRRRRGLRRARDHARCGWSGGRASTGSRSSSPRIAFVSQLVLVALGFAFLFSFSDLATAPTSGVAPSWHAIAFALPAAMLAYTGLETVANLAQEAREPGQDDAAQPLRRPRRRRARLVRGRDRRHRRVPRRRRARRVSTRSASDWLRRPSSASSPRSRASCPALPRRRPARADRRSAVRDPARRGDDLDLRRRRASSTRSGGTRCCRTCSGRSGAAARCRRSDPRRRGRLDHARRSWPPRSGTRCASSPACTASAS